MVVHDSNKTERSVRSKTNSFDSKSDNSSVIGKGEKKHRLKQRFEVIKKLGAGTYGKVQLAINKETGHEVAIKTIKKSKIENEQDLIRIRREIQIMSSIQHPHLVHIFEVFENKEKIVLVMQYASGGEVYEYVSERKVLTDSEARRLFRQIATAVYYCHKNKICHRDLKLENILLDEKGNAKIADFGLSNVFDERHFLSTFCGSPLYASPEIVKGTPYYGPEVDCWSMGVLLYTLVYGAMPFDGSNFKRLVKQISEASYYEPKQKSDASALIKKLLTVNPSKRATIIDICTDWWVNKGYEHSLLQVAEDMANLTPVRLDILLALAPVSPSNNDKTNPLESAVKSNNQSTDVNILDDRECADPMLSQSAKRQASFDQSMSKVSAHTPRKKKSKKSSQGNDPMTVKVPNHGATVASDATESMQIENKVFEPKTNVNQSEQNDAENKKLVSSNDDGSKLNDASHDTVDGSALQNANNSVHETVASESNQNKEMSHEKVIQLNNSQIENSETKTVESETIESPTKCIDNQMENQTQEIPKECESEKFEINKNDEISEASSFDNSIGTDKSFGTESNAEPKKKTNKTIGRRGSGKVMIPQWLSKSESQTSKTSLNKSPSKTVETKLKPNASVTDSKKNIEQKQLKDKTHVFPSLKVSDAKRAFERRCSVPAGVIASSGSSVTHKRSKEFLNDGEELKSEKTKVKGTNMRSHSVVEALESPKRILAIEALKKAKDEQQRVKPEDDANNKVSDENNKSEEIAEPKASPKIANDDRIAFAKDILKKKIAKAQLNEKRQNSIDSDSSSPISTPLPSDQLEHTPSYFRVPRPYGKESISKPQSVTLELKLNQNESQALDSSDFGTANAVERPIKIDIEKQISPETEERKIETPSVQPKPTPIARSYKKVTFTKDGACITETGKIYSSEGSDGSFRRVEKKSKVTHYPSKDDEIQINDSNVNVNTVHRSESRSSSGSTDIFDDIFDDHYSEDSIFPNLSRMRDFMHGFMGNRNERIPRRKSRAESCERNTAGDVIGSAGTFRRGNSNLTDQESDTDNEFDNTGFGASHGLFPFLRPHGSMFDRSSLFSRDFNKHFDKDYFHDFDDIGGNSLNFMRSMSRERPAQSTRLPPAPMRFTSVISNPTSFKEKHNVSASHGTVPSNRYDYRDSKSKNMSKEPYECTADKYVPIDETAEVEHSDYDDSRKRVEQWLHFDDNDNESEFSRRAPLSMYSTVGPRGFRRYLRTISGRTLPSDNLDSDRPSVHMRTVPDYSTRDDPQIRQSSFSTSNVGNSGHNKPLFEMSLTFKPMPLSNATSKRSIQPQPESDTNISASSELSELSDDYQSSITLPESSSLLDQLRTHGYRNMVTQRITSPPIFTSPIEGDHWKSLSSDNDPKSAHKRGKSFFDSSSCSACFVKNQCMDNTNTAITKSAAADRDAHTETIAEPCAAAAEHRESAHSDKSNNEQNIINMSLKHTVNLQSCEPTSSVTHTACSNTTGICDTMPESNHKHPIQTHKTASNDNVNLKETVHERIHRKSFYSRFNDDRPLSMRSKRRSFIDDDDFDFGLRSFRRTPSVSFSSTSTSPSTLSHRSSFSKEDTAFITSKSSLSNDWFQRIEMRASQLMDDLLDNNKDNKESDQFRTHNNITGTRRRSSSAVRSSYFSDRSDRSAKSTNSSHSKSFYNHAHDNDDNGNENNDNFRSRNNNSLSYSDDDDGVSPTEVLRRAIDILTQNAR